MNTPSSSPPTGPDPVTLKQLLDFYEGKLSKEAERAFEQRLLNEPLLAAALEEMDKSGKSAADIRQQTQAFEATLKETARAQSRSTGRPAAGWIRYAAVVLVLLSAGSITWQLLGRGANDFVPYQLENQSVRGSSAEANELAKAFELYQLEQYSETVEALMPFKEDHPEIEKILLVRGNALLAQGKPKEAILTLEKLVQNQDWVLYRTEAEKALEQAREMQ